MRLSEIYSKEAITRERDAYRAALVAAALDLRGFTVSRMDLAVMIERVLIEHAKEKV